MRFIKTICLTALFLSGCSTLSQFKYDSAEHFDNLKTRWRGTYSYNDKIDEYHFDSIVLFHVKIIDRSAKPERYDDPVAILRLTDEYLNSSEELKKEIYWRGDFARYYHHDIYGNWMNDDTGNKFDTYAIFGVQSKIRKVILTKMSLKFFTGSKWLNISINKTFKIIPGSINYLGTLYIEVATSGEYSGRTMKQAYFQYDTAIVEGNAYNTQWKLSFEESDFKNDKKTLKLKYPNLFEKYKDDFQIIQ